MRDFISLFVVVTLLGGCTFDAWYKDFATPSEKLAPPKFQLLSLGMSKEEVVSAIGSPDQLVGAKRTGNDMIETWEYIRMDAVVGPDQIAERYQVVFRNGKLSSYESSGDFKQQIHVK